MKRLLSAASRPARLPMIVPVLLSVVISACGAPDRAAPPTQAQAAPAATAAQPTNARPATVAAQKPTAQPTQTGSSQQGQVAATPIPTCSFNAAAGPEPQVPALEAYTFSEPKVILTDKLIGVDEWLPDNQRLLISRSLDGGKRIAYETIDVQTGTTQRYAEQARYRMKSVWLQAEQAVAFAEVRSNDKVVLRISRGPGAPVEDVVSDLASPFLAVSADGQQVAFVARAERGQPRVLRAGQGRQVRPLAGPVRRPDGGPVPVQLEAWEALRAAWRPDGRQIAWYTEDGFYLTDVVTGQVCAVDLGGNSDYPGKRWALSAAWSPDGRFLAARTTIGGSVGNRPFVDITVLDTVTGALRYITLDVRYIYELAWLPNSRQLLVLGQFERGSKYANPHLFITDISTGAFQRVVPDHQFGSSTYDAEGGGLAVSPDGQRVAVKCSLPQEDRLCIIDLSTRP